MSCSVSPAFAERSLNRAALCADSECSAKDEQCITQYRGLAQVTNWVKLKFVAMNLKKLATWKWRAFRPALRLPALLPMQKRPPGSHRVLPCQNARVSFSSPPLSGRCRPSAPAARCPARRTAPRHPGRTCPPRRTSRRGRRGYNKG